MLIDAILIRDVCSPSVAEIKQIHRRRLRPDPTPRGINGLTLLPTLPTMYDEATRFTHRWLIYMRHVRAPHQGTGGGWKSTEQTLSPSVWRSTPSTLRSRLTPWIQRDLKVISSIFLKQIEVPVEQVIRWCELDTSRVISNCAARGSHVSNSTARTSATPVTLNPKLPKKANPTAPLRPMATSPEAGLDHHWILEYVISVFRAHAPQSHETMVALEGFLHEYTSFFVHELVTFARSPWNLRTFDQEMEYPEIPSLLEMQSRVRDMLGSQ
jgi:hypothetical protein